MKDFNYTSLIIMIILLTIMYFLGIKPNRDKNQTNISKKTNVDIFHDNKNKDYCDVTVEEKDAYYKDHNPINNIYCKSIASPDGHEFFTVKEFFQAEKESDHNLHYPGIYILHNIDKDIYYVGQSHDVAKRVKQHLLGSGGNADVYADKKYGDTFYIALHYCHESDLDRLEKYLIEYYHAYDNGYNKTAGNS